MLLAAPFSVCRGASGTWDTPTGHQIYVPWDTPSYWLDDIVAGGAGSTAYFAYFVAGSSGSQTPYDSYVSLNAPLTLGGIAASGSGTGYTHNIAISGSGSLTLDGDGSTPTISSMLGSGRRLTIGVPLAGNQGLTLSESGGSIYLTTANTYSGTTTLTGGTVYLAHSQALGATGAGNNTLLSGGRLFVAPGITIAGETATLAGGVLAAGSSGVGEWAGDVVLATSNLRLDALTGGTLLVSGTISSAGGANLGFGAGAEYQGTLVLSGANTYSGDTTIYRGTLKLANGDNRLPTSTVLDVWGADPATFDLNGYNQTVAGLRRSGTNSSTVTNSSATAATFTLNAATASSSYSGVISGNLSLAKAGANQLQLSGANTYSGDTIVYGGTLKLAGGDNRLPISTVLDVWGAVPATFDLNGQNQTVAGLKRSGSDSSTVTNSSATAATFTLNAAAASSAYSGLVSGNLSLVKEGVERLELSGSNTYTGTTSVNAGSLAVDGSLDASTSPVGVVAGARLTGDGTIRRPITVDAGATLAGNLTVAPQDNTSATIAGTLAPGNSIGTLTFDLTSTTGGLLLSTGATLEFELGAPGSGDLVRIVGYQPGDLILNNNLIELIDFGGLAKDTTYPLFAFFATDGVTPVEHGLTGGLLLGTVPTGFTGFQLDFSSDPSQILLYVIPEPASLALLAMGLGALTRRRRPLG